MAQCLSPFTKKDTRNAFPCGKCYTCKMRRIHGWAFRLQQQGLVSESALFITLTYDTTHVPITPNGFMSLNKNDLQLFWKRLRKRHHKRSGLSHLKISYYVAGEYGGETHRPHYHAIVFNAHPDDISEAWKQTPPNRPDDEPTPIGHIHFGTLTIASIVYTLKYISKDSIIPIHKRDDRTKEFSNMSKGLGASYMTPQMIKWHKSDMLNRMYLPQEDNKKIAMPRYYKEKIYTRIQREHIGIYTEEKLIEEYLQKSDEQLLEEIDIHKHLIKKSNQETRTLKI